MKKIAVSTPENAQGYAEGELVYGSGKPMTTIFKVADSWLGLYRRRGEVVSFLLSPKGLPLPDKKENRPGLIDPLACYLGKT